MPPWKWPLCRICSWPQRPYTSPGHQAWVQEVCHQWVLPMNEGVTIASHGTVGDLVAQILISDLRKQTPKAVPTLWELEGLCVSWFLRQWQSRTYCCEVLWLAGQANCPSLQSAQTQCLLRHVLPIARQVRAELMTSDLLDGPRRVLQKHLKRVF